MIYLTLALIILQSYYLTHPDFEDNIFNISYDLSGAELNIDITDLSLNFTQIRDYYTIKTGETVNGITNYDEEVYIYPQID